MENSKRIICSRKFWVHTDRPLPEIAQALQANGVVIDARHDSENVYEWLECRLPGGGVELNISRKHNDGEIDDREPLGFMLIGADEYAMSAIVDVVASRVQAALKMPVMIGTIEHLGGDDYRYVGSQLE